MSQKLRERRTGEEPTGRGGNSAASRWLRAGVAGAVVVAAGVVGDPSALADGPTTFTNSATIAVPATGSPSQIGVASPYPSGITVSGMAGPVTTVKVVLDNVSHSSLGDVDVMVASPAGTNLVVMSDAGDVSSLIFANNATLTFDDAASSPLPQSGSVPTGSYRPTNGPGLGADAFPAPAPAPSSQTTLAGAFSGIDPNGTWNLYAVDDATGDVGQFAGGWSLVITTAVAAVPTTTTVVSSVNPSTTGDSVTFTATVTASGSPVTVGTVQFRDNGTLVGSAVPLNASGQAALTTSALTEGSHLVTATYSGATDFLTSNGSLSQRVDNATVVTGNTFCNPGAIAQAGQGASTPYPSNVTVSGLVGAVTDVTATLNGLSHTAPIDLDVMLSAPIASTNVVLLSDAGGQAPVSGLTVGFDDSAPGAVPDPLVTGTFRPTDNDPEGAVDAFPSPAPLPSTATTLSTFGGSNPNGQWSLWVHDDATGDSGAIVGGWCLTVTTTSPTTTTVASGVNPSTAGQSVTFTATVTAGANPVTAGTVQFSEGATALGSPVALATDGTATYTTSALSVGTHPITATYSGTSTLLTSNGTVSQVVNQAATSTDLTSSVNPSTAGQPVTFTATVTTGGNPVTTGTVQFSDDGAPLGAPVTVAADGTAAFTTSALTAGTHPIAATYSGTSTLAGSSDTIEQLVGGKVATTVDLTSSSNPAPRKQPVTFSATITTASGAAVTTGAVRFYDGYRSLGAPVAVAADGTATLTTSALRVGTHTIRATFTGTPMLRSSTEKVRQVIQTP